MNTLIITGNLTRDCIHLQGKHEEIDLLLFSIANNEGCGDNKKTTFFDCSYARKSLTKLAPFLSKGTAVLLRGTPSIKEWASKDGTVHYSLSLKVGTLEIIGGKPQQAHPLQASLSGQQAESPAPVPRVNPEEERLPF